MGHPPGCHHTGHSWSFTEVPQRLDAAARTCRYLPSLFVPVPADTTAPRQADWLGCALLLADLASTRPCWSSIVLRLLQPWPATPLSYFNTSSRPPGTRLCRNHRLVYKFPAFFDHQKGSPEALDSGSENAAKGGASSCIISHCSLPLSSQGASSTSPWPSRAADRVHRRRPRRPGALFLSSHIHRRHDRLCRSEPPTICYPFSHDARVSSDTAGASQPGQDRPGTPNSTGCHATFSHEHILHVALLATWLTRPVG